jgi:hypothetical protein
MCTVSFFLKKSSVLKKLQIFEMKTVLAPNIVNGANCLKIDYIQN